MLTASERERFVRALKLLKASGEYDRVGRIESEIDDADIKLTA